MRIQLSLQAVVVRLLQSNPLCNLPAGLEEEQEQGMIDAMFERTAEAGEVIIT